jgi:hypothetical protein
MLWKNRRKIAKVEGCTATRVCRASATLFFFFFFFLSPVSWDAGKRGWSGDGQRQIKRGERTFGWMACIFVVLVSCAFVSGYVSPLSTKVNSTMEIPNDFWPLACMSTPSHALIALSMKFTKLSNQLASAEEAAVVEASRAAAAEASARPGGGGGKEGGVSIGSLFLLSFQQ